MFKILIGVCTIVYLLIVEIFGGISLNPIITNIAEVKADAEKLHQEQLTAEINLFYVFITSWIKKIAFGWNIPARNYLCPTTARDKL